MRQGQRWVVWAVGILVGLGILGVERGSAGESGYVDDTMPPTVFQPARPTIEAIQGTVDQFRAALGEPNNANGAGPLASGRREINWDGGGSTETAVAGTPFDWAKVSTKDWARLLYPSNSSSNALASWRSAVSKPSVNQLYTGASTSWASARLPCCCHRRLRLIAARSSHDLAC
jgi:hypothetical protein